LLDYDSVGTLSVETLSYVVFVVLPVPANTAHLTAVFVREHLFTLFVCVVVWVGVIVVSAFAKATASGAVFTLTTHYSSFSTDTLRSSSLSETATLRKRGGGVHFLNEGFYFLFRISPRSGVILFFLFFARSAKFFIFADPSPTLSGGLGSGYATSETSATSALIFSRCSFISPTNLANPSTLKITCASEIDVLLL